MANFIKLTSDKSELPVLVNADSIAWVSPKEIKGGQNVTVLYFSAAYAIEPISVTVKEDYDTVFKKITS